MNLYQYLIQRQTLLISLFCLIVLPSLIYRYPSQVISFFTYYTFFYETSSPHRDTEAEMLNDFVDFLRNQDNQEVKKWAIKGTLVTPYTSADLDALINIDLFRQPQAKDTLRNKQRFCNQKNILYKKS